MKRIILILVLLVSALGHTFAQEYGMKIWLHFNSDDHNIEAQSYYQFKFYDKNNNLITTYREGIYGIERGKNWYSEYSLKFPPNQAIAKIELYADHRDDPTGPGDNKQRGSKTTYHYITYPTEYPCKSYSFKGNLIGSDDSNNSTLKIELFPISTMWAATVEINANDLYDQKLELQFGDGTVQTENLSLRQDQRDLFFTPNKSGIKKATLYYNNNRTFSKNFDPVLEEDAQVTFSDGSKVKLNYLVTQLEQRGGSGILSTEDTTTITTKEDHNKHSWFYSFDASNWISFPGRYGTGGTINTSGFDLLGSDATTHLGENIYLKVQYPCPSPNAETSILPLRIIPSAPHIDTVSYTSPLCHAEATAKMQIKFDRKLYDGENLYISIRGDRFTQADTTLISIDPITFKIPEITGLEAGTYDISLYGTFKNSLMTDTLNTYTEGVHHKYQIVIPDRPSIKLEAISQNAVHCYGGKDGKISVKASGGIGVFNAYLKENNILRDSIRFNQGDSAIFKNLKAGTYKVSIKDTNGCFLDNLGQPVESSIAVTQPSAGVSIIDSQFEEPKGFGLSNGNAEVTFIGGSGAYTVEWKDNNGVITQPNITTTVGSTFVNRIENIKSGTYYVTVKDGNYTSASPQINDNTCGCTDTISFFVPQPPRLTVNVGEHHYITCNGDSDGELVAHAAGGRPFQSGMPYRYDWYRSDGTQINSPSANDSIITGLNIGSYKVKITDSNGIFTESAVFVLNQPAPLSVTTRVLQNNTCNGDASGIIEATPTGGIAPYTYVWSTGDTTKTVSGLPQGRYYVTVRDARYKGNLLQHHCLVQASDTITSPQSVVIESISQDPVHCRGGKDGKISIKAGGGAGVFKAYLRQDGVQLDSISFNAGEIAIFNNLYKGNYNVFIKDSNNCLLNISGHPSGGNITVTEPLEKVDILSFSSQEPTGFGLSDGIAEVIFKGGTAPYTVTWKDRQGTIIPAKPIVNEAAGFKSKVENIKSGTYYITVKDANYSQATPQNELNLCGCNDTISFFVEQPPKLEVSINQHRYITCNGDKDGEIVAHAKGGRPHLTGNLPYKYDWYKVAGIQEQPVNINDSIITKLYSGYYKVKITDRNGISTISDVFHLQQPEPLVVTTKVLQNTICSGDKIGIIEAFASGGTPPYTYIWSTNDTTKIVRGLPQGNYVVGVRDARYAENIMSHYCFAQAHDSIISPNSIHINAQIKHPTCSGSNDGKITLQVTGGTAPYKYYWENNSNSLNRSNLQQGNYKIIITDNKGCFIEQAFELTEPSPVVVNLGKDFTLCKNQSVVVNGEIGISDISYKWTDPSGKVLSTEATLTIDKAGVYKLTASTDQGCWGSDEITVGQSNDEVITDFVIATRIANNTKMYAVNITRSSFDSITWVIPDEALMLGKSVDRAEIIFPENGNYSVGLIVHKGLCRNAVYKTVAVVDHSEIEEDTRSEPFLKRFVVAPNPNNGNFDALVELREPADYQLLLFDGNGKLIETKEVKYKMFESTKFIKNGIASGVYYLRLVSKETTSVLKVIIQ